MLGPDATADTLSPEGHQRHYGAGAAVFGYTVEDRAPTDHTTYRRFCCNAAREGLAALYPAADNFM